MKNIVPSSLLVRVAACATASILNFTHALAANGSWLGAEDAAWTNSANWSASPYPGNAVGESASFDGAGNGNTVIDLAGLSSILNVTFGQSAAAYTLGAGAVGSQTLTIENSGRIAMSANATADQTVSAAVRLGTTTASATYTFTNANANQTLTLAGPITGGAEGGTAGAKTLILTGYGKVVLNGVLSNGGSTGITLASYGTNTLAGDNTFSGNITVYDGTLRLTHSNALGLGAKTISANNNVNGRNPSIVLDGSAGDLTIPTNITFQTSNQRAGAVINEAGNNTILGNFTLTTGDGNTHLWSKGGKLTIAGNITPNATSRQLNLRGDADGEISGVIANGTTVNLPIVKDVGTGAWTLSGSNTFSGAITVSSGAITFAGEKGSATAAASINLFTNGTLVLRNTLAANHPNRIGDTTPIILRGGTLAFSNDGSAADFAETVGPLTATSGLVTVSTAAAAAGQTSTLTISSLSCGPNATLNFTGPGLGESNRNKIIINGQADGPLGTWATVNGTAPALYSSTRGVYAEATTGLAAKGDTLTDGAGNLVITTEGAGGPNALSDTVTAIASLSQNSPYASTVDTADKTLRAGMLSIAAGGADLTIGVAPNDGTLTPTAAGGELGLANNNADSTLTVNAVLADNTSPSSFTKYGAGPVVLAATNTLSGPVAISQGTLNLLHGLTLQNASLASAGVTFDAAVANRAFTLGNLTNSFTLPLLNTAAEPITLAVGNNGGNSLFGGVISGGGSLAKIGAGTLTLSGASTYNGGTDIRSGTLATGVAGGLGTGPVTNNATLNLTGGAVTYTALGTTLAGAGTVNVTLGTGTAQTALNGDYSNFTGTWNIGVGAASGAGKAQMNGADNADATINVLENATLYVSQPALHQAAAVLYGGTTGETYGQLRLEGSAEWAGPVTLVGDCLDPSKGFFGSNSGTGTISGAVSDLGGAHPVNKVGGGVFALANPANTYAGPTWVRQGSLIASTIKNVGEASSLGQPADAAAGAIKLGNGTTAARLTYAGTGDTTDRVIDLAGTTGAGYLEQSGTGLLKFTSDLTYSGAGGKSLYLHGSTAGAGELAGVYGDGLPYTNKLIKTGTGQWTLSAANTYRGETEIQEGTLTIAHPNAIPAASTIRMTGTASRNAVLDLANDGAGQTEKNLTIGVGYRGTIAAGAGLDGAAVDHLFNEWSLSLTTVTVTRAASVLSGTPTITVNTVNLSGGNSYRTTISPSDVDVRIGRAAVLSNGNLTKTLHLDGTSTGNVITGAVYNGLSGSTVVLDKTGTGTWTLLGSNTYSGATTVNGGTLALAGPDGAIPSTSSFTVNSGATLRLNNTAASNNTDRLGNAKALTLNGGTLAFSHTAGAADYSETVGAVTVSGAGNAIAASQASEGRTSTLSLASLTRTGNATLDFSGAGLGASDRNRIFIGGLQDGLIGFWTTYGGNGLAAYSAADGVYAGSTAATALAARGPDSVVADNPLFYGRITEDGESGPVTLAGIPLTRAAAVVQAAGTNCLIASAGQTLATHALAIEAGAAALTLGAAEGDGGLTALAPGGKLDLINDSSSPLTINAALSNNAAAVSITKSGNGEVLLIGPCSYSGGTAINAGTLVFASSATQALVGAISGSGSLVKAGTNLLTLAGRNTFTGVTYINAGIVLAQTNAAFGSTAGGTIIANGATLDVGANLAANNLNLGAEAFTVSGSGVDGKGAIVNNSGASQQAVFGQVTLVGDTTFGGAQSGSRFDIRNNTPTLTMNGYTLTKKGPNMFGLTGANVVPGAGHIDVQEGTLRIESNTRMNGDAANTITLRSGTALELYRHYPQNACAWTLVCKDDTLVNLVSAAGSAQSNNWAGPIVLDGTLRLTGAGAYHHVFGGPISGSGSLVKYGATSTYMTNDYNTYSGYTWITNGTVYFTSVGMVGGAASSFGTPADAAAGKIRLGSGASSVTLNYMGTGDTSDRVLELAGTTGGATLNQLGSGALRFTGGMAVTASGNKTLTLGGSTTGTGEIAGTIPNPPASGKVAITKNGTGAWTLSGNNSFTGDVNIAGGTLILSGANAQGNGAINVASAAADAIMRIEPGAQLTGAYGIRVGHTGAAHGALYMTGGAVNRTPATGTDLAFTIGRAAGSYGYFNMSGGDMTITRIQTGASGATTTSNTVGNVRITGGTLTLPDYMLLSRGQGCVGAFTVEGGLVNHTNAAQNLSLGYEGGRAELNMLGGALESYGRNLTVRQSASSPTGIVNLCAGLLSIDLFQNTSPGVALLNFAGGTLKAGKVDSTAFIPTNMNGVYSFGPFGAFAGGAIIDSAGRNITLAAPLRAPTGNGVTGITLADKGSGYIGEPYVAIKGDGIGATAIANMEDDGNGAYRVASVTITCPGTGYTTATVLFNGGGRSAVPPTVDAVTLAPNTSGGLTKQGTGTLTLGAANTYGGATTVAGGTLKLGHPAALPTATQVTLAGGTLDLNGYTVTNAVNGTGTLANGSLRTVLSPAGEGALGSDTVTLSSATLAGGTYLADVSPSGTSDHVTVNGNIDLSGFDLVFVDPDQLDRHQIYTLLTCSGTRTGTFASNNLPSSRWHLVYRANGDVQLLYAGGTLIRLR